MAALPWALIAALAMTGIVMAVVSCLVGMRPKIENPAWWALYALWIIVVLVVDTRAPFQTILVASALVGLLHGLTRVLLMDAYRRNNPWHADQMQGSKGKVATQFVFIGLVSGILFGALAGGLAWGLHRL